MFEYLSSIEALKKYCKELHWVNVGPLKYGTKPLVQFTGDELSRLRKIRGWKDLVEEYEVDSSKGLNGYLTDYESMYKDTMVCLNFILSSKAELILRKFFFVSLSIFIT